MMDCDLQPTGDGRFKCSRPGCGRTLPKLAHCNCRVPEDPAVAALRTARLAICLARDCSCRDQPAPYCLPMRARVAATACRLRALLAAALIAEKPICEWWPE